MKSVDLVVVDVFEVDDVMIGNWVHTHCVRVIEDFMCGYRPIYYSTHICEHAGSGSSMGGMLLGACRRRLADRRHDTCSCRRQLAMLGRLILAGGVAT